jgi:hypothetical protein
MSHSPAIRRPDPHSLPFDQYGRYQMISEALEAARPLVTPNRGLRVLDVGGYYRTRRGEELFPLRLFLPDDGITVVDQVASELPGYVQGDGRRLTFDDAAFDFVVSCDTLEHVPAPDRAAFWDELLRVARCGVLLAAPFDLPEVVAAESLLFDYIKAELGVEQVQLREHATYGLPHLPTVQGLLDARGLRYQIYPSGYVHAWLFLMVAKHYLFGRSSNEDLHEQIDAYYTRFFAPRERCEPAYRHMVAVARTDDVGWLAAVDAALAPTILPPRPADAPWPELTAWLFQLLGWQLEDRGLPALLQATTTQAEGLAAQAQTIETLQRTLAQRDAHLHDLEQRSRWLAAQADAAQRELAAIKSGHLLRLLRWLQQRRATQKGNQQP